MKITFTIFIILTILMQYDAKSEEVEMGKGVVILQDETVLFGDISYYQKVGLVTVNKGNRLLTYAPGQVRLFHYYDQDKSINRIYISVIVAENRQNVLKKKEFLEIATHGKISILRKEKTIVVEKVQTNDRGSILTYNLASNPVAVKGFDYYYYDNNQAYLIKNFKAQVLPLMKDRELPIRLFIREKKLDLRKWEDQFKILNYYDQLPAFSKKGN